MDHRRITLPVFAGADAPARPPRTRPADRTPVVDRKRALRVAKDALKQPTLEAAAAYLLGVAETLPDRTRNGRPGWKALMARTAEALAHRRYAAPVFTLEGNAKLPFVAFSALPVFTCPGMGACRTFCYSFRSWRCPSAYLRQVQNTLLLRHAPEVVERCYLALPHDLTLRLYVDGDFDSPHRFAWWMDLLPRRGDLAAYGYSKSWDIIWDHVQRNQPVAPNYVLNLSSGGKPQRVTADQLLALPFVRGWFVAVPHDYRPENHRGNVGFARYSDPAYHRAVLKAARAQGIASPKSCPGFCGACNWCGDLAAMKGKTIVNGTH